MATPIRRNVAAAGAAWSLVLASLVAAEPLPGSPSNSGAARSPLPIVFEANHGQVDPRVKFLARGAGYALFITGAEAVLADRGTGQAVRVRLRGARPDVEVTGLEPLPGRIHYLRGRDPAGWRTGVPTYARVAYREAYPGIDAIYRTATESRFEQEFLVRPDADPAAIRLAFDGVQSVAVDDAGDLVLSTEGAAVRLGRPVAYQEIDGVRHAVSAAWSTRRPKEAGFRLGPYDRSRALVIDPVITWATYLGGSRTDQAFAIAVDSAGNSYVTGDTNSDNFPTTDGSHVAPGPARTFPGGCGDSTDQGFGIAVTGDSNGTSDTTCTFTVQEPSIDVFVTKLDATGQALVYSVYIGGGGTDGGRGIALDPSGNAYVAGFTDSTDFPITVDAFQSQHGGDFDAFVVKLSPAGTLVYATYLGGRNGDEAFGIAVDAAGRAHVAGGTRSPDFPIVSASQPLLGGGGGALCQESPLLCPRDAFITRLSPQGLVEYSTFLGGTGDDVANAIALDDTGNAYVTGAAQEAFPTTPGSLRPNFGGGVVDAFAARIDANAALGWATYLGGIDTDVGMGIAVDAEGRPHVAGSTASNNFPATGGDHFTGTPDTEGFVLRLAADGSAIDWSRNTGKAMPAGVALDERGQTYLVGSVVVTVCTGFTCSPSPTDVTVETRSVIGERLSFISFGGHQNDFGQAIAVRGSSLWVTGITEGSGQNDFPTTPGTFQASWSGGRDAFVVKLGEAAVAADGGIAANGGSSGGGCLIATAAFGSPLAREVETFRRFRDRALLTHAPGRVLVGAYYRLSPPLARAIAREPFLAAGVRALLGPVAFGAGFAMDRPSVAIGLAGVGLAAIIGLAVMRGKNVRRIRAAAVICLLLGGMLLVVAFALKPREAISPSLAPTLQVGRSAKAQSAPGTRAAPRQSQTSEAALDFTTLLGGGASVTPLNPFVSRGDRRFAVTSELIEGILSADGFVVTDPRRTRALGIEAGDTIVRVNGYPPTGLVAVITTLQRDPDRATVVLEIDRTGRRLVQSYRVR